MMNLNAFVTQFRYYSTLKWDSLLAKTFNTFNGQINSLNAIMKQITICSRFCYPPLKYQRTCHHVGFYCF